MRGIFGLVLLVGMALAGFAVYMVNQQIEQQNDELTRIQRQRDGAVRTVDVYSINKAFTYGDLLTADDVVLIKYARNSLPQGVIRDLDVLFPPEEAAKSRVVVLPMLPNEPLMENKLARPGASRGLTALVEPGMRAFPIRGRITGGLGVLRPDDRIDLYWTGRLSNGRQVTRLLKASLEIIAAPDPEGRQQGIRNVVVQVTPEEVAILTQAQSTGSLTISLVGSGDAALEEDISVDKRSVTQEVFEAVEAPVVEEEEEICYRYERRGTERVRFETPCNN